MQIAYLHSDRPSVYQDDFFAAIRTRWGGERFTDYNQIRNPKDFDCLFIDFAGQNAVVATKNEHPNIIIRTMGLEIYESNLKLIDWPNVNHLLFLNTHQMDYFKRRWEYLKCCPQHKGIIHFHAPLERFTLRKEQANDNVAMIANITGRKGVDQIPEFLNRYKNKRIYYLGKVCKYGSPVWEFVHWRLNKDKNISRFTFEKIKSFGEIDYWLNDKSFLWLPTVQEGQSRVILEAMTKGITPIIRGHGGCYDLWPHDLIYDSMDEIDKIIKNPWPPERLRDYVSKRFSQEKMLDNLEKHL